VEFGGELGELDKGKMFMHFYSPIAMRVLMTDTFKQSRGDRGSRRKGAANKRI
jgi:hypothetical protein